MELNYFLPGLAELAVDHALARYEHGVTIPPAIIEGTWEEIERCSRARHVALRAAAKATLDHFESLEVEQRRARFLAAILDDDGVTGGDAILLAAAIEVGDALDDALDEAWSVERVRLMKAAAIDGKCTTR